MTRDRDEFAAQEQRVAEQARTALDQSLDDISPEVLQGLRAARKKALASGRQPAIYRFVSENRMVWGGAIAAAVSVLAITLVLQDSPELRPGTDAESLLTLAELDETEWQLVQDDLEFALWLSELTEDELAQASSG